MAAETETASVLLLAETPSESVREGFRRWITQTDHLMTVVLDIDNGPWPEADPHHSHPHEQISYVVNGELLFLAEGSEPRHLKAGDLFMVPGNVPHSIQLLSKSCRLIDTFTPIREDFLKNQS